MSQITNTVECWKCKQQFDIVMLKESYDSWQDGELIQDALSELTSGERELLLSKTCGDCFDILFPPEDEDEE